MIVISSDILRDAIFEAELAPPDEDEGVWRPALSAILLLPPLKISFSSISFGP